MDDTINWVVWAKLSCDYYHFIKYYKYNWFDEGEKIDAVQRHMNIDWIATWIGHKYSVKYYSSAMWLSGEAQSAAIL